MLVDVFSNTQTQNRANNKYRMADEEYEQGEENEQVDAENNAAGEEGDDQQDDEPQSPDALGETAQQQEKQPDEQKEILPDKKPFTGEVLIDLKDSGSVRVLFKDSSLPPWLPYLLADDVFYYLRELEASSGGVVPAATEASPDRDGGLEGPPNVANTIFSLSPNADGSYSAWLGEAAAVAAPVQRVGITEPPKRSAADADGDGDDGAADEQQAPAVAAADVVSNDTRASLPDLAVDAVTLAALFSAEILKRFFAHPTTLLTSLQQWIVAQGPSDTILNNISGAKPSSKNKLKIDYNPIFQQMQDDSASSSTWKVVLNTFAKAGLHAQKPVDPALITTPQLAIAFVQLLAILPRSQISTWTQPKREADEDRTDEASLMFSQPLSYLLGNIVLELRRRDARCCNGRPAPKIPASQVVKKFIPANPAQIEDLDDLSVSKDFSRRPYFPVSMYLYQSDLALVALGLYAQHEDLLPAFQDLLALKRRKSRRHDDASGTFQLLYHALPLFTCEIGQHVINVSPSWKLFTPTGLVHPQAFAASAAAELVQKEPRLVKSFARKFFLEISSQDEIMKTLEKTAPTMHESLSKCSQLFDSLLREVQSGTANAERLEGLVANEELDAATVFSPIVLHQALYARNFSVLKHLIGSKGVVSTQRDFLSHEVDVLEAALDESDASLLQHIVGCGISLNTVVFNGLHSGLSLVQTLHAGDFEAALELWRTVERNRVADPTKKHGLLRNVINH